MSEELTIKIKKENIWKYSTFVLGAILLIWIVVSMTGDDTRTTGTTGTQQLPTQQGRVEVPINDNDPSMGDEDAPVTIIEFTDFSCPFCGGAAGENQEVVAYLKQNDPSWQAPLPGIIENYVKTGKARLVLKYFPGHGTGEPAHTVGWCLYDQDSDAFWEYHDLAFAQQDKTSDLAAMKALALQAGADSGELESCISSNKYQGRFAEDTNVGRAAGVSGTPGFIINGQSFSGAYSFTTFESVIEAEL